MDMWLFGRENIVPETIDFAGLRSFLMMDLLLE
jgi:hypothetical protein